jgi:hypothetical protein
MADKLVIIEAHDFWRIIWSLDDGDDIGAHLGDNPPTTVESPSDKEEAELWYAEREAQLIYNESLMGGRIIKDSYGYGWESRKDVTADLKRIEAAVKVGLDNRPWPEWAQQALKHGWKPPKGWRP